MDGEKSMNSGRFYFLGLQNYLEVDCCHEIKMHAPWEESYNKPRQYVKKQRHHFADLKAMVFSSSHVQMWELDHKEGWALKNWCFQTVVLEKTWELLGL